MARKTFGPAANLATYRVPVFGRDQHVVPLVTIIGCDVRVPVFVSGEQDRFWVLVTIWYKATEAPPGENQNTSAFGMSGSSLRITSGLISNVSSNVMCTGSSSSTSDRFPAGPVCRRQHQRSKLAFARASSL